MALYDCQMESGLEYNKANGSYLYGLYLDTGKSNDD